MKAFVAGVWTLVVSLGAVYAVAAFEKPPQSALAKAEKPNLQVEKTRVINVPIIAGGTIRGYIVAQFAYTMDPAQAKTLSISPDVFICDEAFRAIYTDDHLDFLHLAKYDVNKLTAHLIAETNRRLGVDLVHDILVQDFTYFSKEENER